MPLLPVRLFLLVSLGQIEDLHYLLGRFSVEFMSKVSAFSRCEKRERVKKERKGVTLSQLVCSLHKPMDGLTVITLRNFKNILLNAYCILLSLTTSPS